MLTHSRTQMCDIVWMYTKYLIRFHFAPRQCSVYCERPTRAPLSYTALSVSLQCYFRNILHISRS